MKYIRIRHTQFIIFSETFAHDEVANKMRIKKEDILGAGFISIKNPKEVSCRGKSISLNIGSDPKDTEVLQEVLQGY